MKIKGKFVSILLTVTMLLSLIPTTAMFTVAADPGSALEKAAENIGEFKITSVNVVNERVATVYLNKKVGNHFKMYALAQPAFLTYYLKLDGEFLHNEMNIAVGAASRIYIRDDQKSFDLVLGPSVTTGTYNGPTFNPEGGTLQFDFASREFTPISHRYGGVLETTQSGDTWIRDDDDNPMSQNVVSYPASTLDSAPNLAVSDIRILDNRAIYVKFNQRITQLDNASGSGIVTGTSLLNRMYVFGQYPIVPQSGGAAINAAYSYRLYKGHPLCTTGEGSEFIIYYQDDLLADTEYIYNWTNAALKGYINAAGADAAALTGTISSLPMVPASDFKLLNAELIVSESGKNEIELTFDRPFAYTRIASESRFRTANAPNSGVAWSNKLYDVRDESGNIVLPGAANYDTYDTEDNRTQYQGLFETSVGMCGTILTADDVKEILTLSGVKTGATDFLDAFYGDEVIGFFKDSHTIVIHNQNRLPITLDENATVSIKAEALVGYGTRGAWGTRNVGTPAEGLTQNTVGYMTSKTNGPRNSATAPLPITKNDKIIPYADGYDPNWSEGVKITDSVVKFGHGDYDYFQYDGEKDPIVGGTDTRIRHGLNVPANAGLGISGANKQNYFVQSTYKSVTLENKYIKATFTEPAARFLNFIYKPTGHDAFYNNPTGVIYGQGSPSTVYPPANGSEGTFVIGWLMVWGGTFPVFDGCEHARIWTTNFPFEVIENEDGSVTVQYKIKDDFSWSPILNGTYVPSSTNTSVGGRFQPYAVNVEYTFEYTVKPDSPVVDMTVTVYNPNNVTKTYEYYTCNTLAPGEDTEWGSGTMKHVDNTQILMHQGYNGMTNVNTGEVSNDKTTKDVKPYSSFNAATVNAKDSEGNFIIPQQVRDYTIGSGRSDVYGSVNREDYYWYSTMRNISNHANSTNFATDLPRLPQADWYGGVNQSNLEGVMRSGKDLMKSTPAIKYWLWSYTGMFNGMPFERNAGSSSRPYLEPWAGSGTQYFHNRAIASHETHKWTESYFHSFGLTDGTNTTPEAMANLKFYKEGNQYRAVAELYATRLEKNLRAVLRTDDGTTLRTDYNFKSKIMAHEVIEASTLVPAGTKVWLELYDGNEKIFDAWAEQGKAFEADRKLPVTEVVISHGKTDVPNVYEIELPGRTTNGSTKYHFREIFAHTEPFAAEGSLRVHWTPESGDIGEVLLTSGAGGPGGVGVTQNNNASWWHSYDYTLIRGLTPGKSVTFKATAKDENAQPNPPYATLKVNVLEPLYLELPNNPGITAGYGKDRYSPYNFNLDMVVPLTISKHADGVIADGPINIEIYDMFNEQINPFISFKVDGIGKEHELLIPAYTLPRQDYYKIVARTAAGDAIGYEYFRVDGYSDIDWTKEVTANGSNINIKYVKKNASVLNTLSLTEDAKAYVNGVECSVSVGTTTTGVNTANTNTFIIEGGNDVAVSGENIVEIVGVIFTQYPNYTFTISDTYVK